MLWDNAIDTEYEQVWQQFCSGTPWEAGPDCILGPVQYRTLNAAEQEYLRKTDEVDSTMLGLFLLSYLLIVWPSFAVGAKRMRDTGLSAWCILIVLVPFLGNLLATLWLGFVPTEETNLQDSQPTASGDLEQERLPGP